MTLNNSIAPFAVSQAQYESRLLQKSGESIATGINQSVGVIEDLIGSAENDTCAIAWSTLKATTNATNMLEIGQSRIVEGSNALTRGLGIIGNSGGNPGHLDRLQEQLDASKAQLDTMLRSADFDSIGLFSGEAKNFEIPVGTSITDTVKISLPDLLNGKLYRTSITTELNKWIVANPGQTTYYANAGEIETDAKNNVNLIACSIANAGGTGTGGGAMTDQQIGNALLALTPKSKQLLDQMAPTSVAFLTNANPGVTFVNADAAQLTAMIGNAPSKAEVVALLQDNMATNISRGDGDALARDRLISENVLTNAANTLRQTKATINSKQDHITFAADSLRNNINVTQKSADSYLKTDYLKTVQEFSDQLKALMAAISAIQGSNKSVEATQRFMSSTLDR
ncbi:MAG: hypothetical protein AB8B66_06435 [Rickettsiaceae bacterium]